MVTFMAKFLLYTSLLCHNDMLVKKKKKTGQKNFFNRESKTRAKCNPSAAACECR